MNSYEKMLHQFEGLLSESCSYPHESAHGLSKANAMAATTGYRHIATAESYGFLKRNRDGVYGVGDRAFHVGLTALGAGRLAPFLSAVLIHLRKNTRRTAFVGIGQGDLVRMGPFSMGRAVECKRPAKLYQSKIAHIRPEQPHLFMALRDSEPPHDCQHALALPLDCGNSQGYLGLITHGANDPYDTALAVALTQARDHLKEALLEEQK